MFERGLILLGQSNASVMKGAGVRYELVKAISLEPERGGVGYEGTYIGMCCGKCSS